MDQLLKVQGLTRVFGGLVAVSDLDFEVRQKEILGLIGPNGAGKSTTFNLISGFTRPTRGNLTLSGKDVTGKSPEYISRQGLVRTFQHSSLMRSMTVHENILVGAMGALPHGRHAQRLARVQETAELLGLENKLDEVAGNLPHGLQRLVSIAIAFAHRPILLCLDEPLTGLNQTEVMTTLDVFRRFRDEFGSSVLLVEHNMKAVMQICDRIVVLHHGRMLATGTPENVSNDQSVIDAYLGVGHAK